MTGSREEGRAKSPATIKAVARAAGVGLATASRALNPGSQEVAEDTRIRVQRVAAELGYRPSALARDLKRQRTDTIGLVVADISNTFYGEFTQAVIEAAGDSNRHVLVGSSQEEPGREASFVDVLLEKRVDGIIAFPTAENAESWRAARDLGVVVVFADRTLAGLDVPSVVVDNAGGMLELAGHVLSMGHRKVGYLGGPNTVSSSRERELGFRRAMRRAGARILPGTLMRTGFTRTSAVSTAERLVSNPGVSALIAANNVLGEAAFEAAVKLGRAVPDDLSIAMFDEVPWATVVSSGITVQAQPTEDLGRAAVQLLTESRSGLVPDPSQLVLSTYLIPRGTTRSIAASGRPTRAKGTDH